MISIQIPLELAVQEIGLPLILGLTDIDCTEENQYIPSFIVIMPDLLMDVTSIAQTWTKGADPMAVNIIDLFLPSASSEAILTGHVANFFLDELIRDTSLTYSDLFTRSFKIYPIEFVQMTDDQVKGMHNRMQIHFDNIRNVIEERFPVLGINRLQCVIEPSYFSPQFGIKGRLDLYYHHEKEEGASIIELKSGRPFKPNSYGLSSANYHQTLLYELIIKSVHGPKHHLANFILYSAVADNTLRFAVSVESLQKETIQNRNELVLLQFRMLQSDKEGSRDIMVEIDPVLLDDLKGYVRKNIETWHNVYDSLSPGEKSYFKAFTGFITREHMLARIGNENGEGAGGLAGLWLDKMATKEERYQILRGLKLKSVDKSANHTVITFVRGEQTNPLANFRAGDIAVMYPYDPSDGIDPTKYQLHRSNVISVDAHEVIIKLRNIQIHTGQIEKIKFWNLEHDLLDSSFRSLYQSLWAFISSDINRRQLIFGLKRPSDVTVNNQWPLPAGLTPTQNQIYGKALDAGPLYLLWGPPGTGKTSRMLKSWVWYYYFHTKSRIALLAYTNRAVDEICQALHELGDEVINHYIRIGSRAASGEAFRNRLMDIVIEPMTKRIEIKNLLNQTRIFVATVASLQGKNEIFKLIDFDVAIIDEASQILEPAMVGLLTQFRKTILIGDHMQLPAVSAQSSRFSKITSDQVWASRIGLSDMGMSYFERIYRLYSSKGWNHMIGILSEQGRMHHEIQAFANQFVYNHQLTCLHPESQGMNLDEFTGHTTEELFNKRLIYIPTQSNLHEVYLKTNNEEAGKVIDLITQWQEIMQINNLNWTIGVITPFRAQIAAILHAAHLAKTNMKNVSVDTVERYQGGARDIIIMSSSVNNRQTLSRIISLNPEGIDRKLNVAVTRARQQFILLGNESFLMEEPAYRALIGMSVRLEAAFHKPTA
jgi:DNA replication ATP-dependent helicase Dna2